MLANFFSATGNDRGADVLPLELGRRGLAVYMWRLAGLSLNFLMALFIYVLALILSQLDKASNPKLTMFCSFVAIVLALGVSYKAGEVLKSRVETIPREVRIATAPLFFVFYFLTALAVILVGAAVIINEVF